MTFSASLQLSPGSGRLARRLDGLLFVPAAADSSEPAGAFVEASSVSLAARAIKDLLIARDFEGPAFVLVQWESAEPIVTVFGDVEARTSSREAPLLSGASSKGFVEHRPDASATTSVHVGEVDAIDPLTSLVAGSVVADGFALKLEAMAESSLPTPNTDTAPSMEPLLVAPPHGGVEDADLLVAPPHGGVGDADLLVAPPHGGAAPSQPFEASWSPADLLADDPAPQASPTNSGGPAPVSPAMARAAEASDESVVASASVAQVPQASDTPVTTPLAAAQPFLSTGPLVEARVCSCGMANPPTETLCRRCNQPIREVEITIITRPCVAVLELTDGSVIDLDTNLSIGRDPNPQASFDAVVVELPGVSRHHVDIKLDGWDILVTDRSSKNGVMVAGEDGVPTTIEPEKAWLIRLGFSLYLGTNEVRVLVPLEQDF